MEGEEPSRDVRTDNWRAPSFKLAIVRGTAAGYLTSCDCGEGASVESISASVSVQTLALAALSVVLETDGLAVASREIVDVIDVDDVNALAVGSVLVDEAELVALGERGRGE